MIRITLQHNGHWSPAFYTNECKIIVLEIHTYPPKYTELQLLEEKIFLQLSAFRSAFTWYPPVIIMWKSGVTQSCGALIALLVAAKRWSFVSSAFLKDIHLFLVLAYHLHATPPSICYAFTKGINNCIFYRLFLSAQALQESHRSLGKRGHCHEAVSIRTRTKFFS